MNPSPQLRWEALPAVPGTPVLPAMEEAWEGRGGRGACTPGRQAWRGHCRHPGRCLELTALVGGWLQWSLCPRASSAQERRDRRWPWAGQASLDASVRGVKGSGWSGFGQEGTEVTAHVQPERPSLAAGRRATRPPGAQAGQQSLAGTWSAVPAEEVQR